MNTQDSEKETAETCGLARGLVTMNSILRELEASPEELTSCKPLGLVVWKEPLESFDEPD